MFRRFLTLLFVLILIGGAGWAGWYYWLEKNHEASSHHQAQTQEKQSSSSRSGQSRKADVGFIMVRPISINRTNQLPGRVISFQRAEIRPQVSGIIQSRLFKEGSYVDEGQQLYQIDPARFEAEHQRAQANLQDARARVKNAQNLVNRFKELIGYNAVSKQEFDDAQAGLDQAKAAVALAEADVRTAKINLDYTKVYSPISGYISPSNVTKGALVTAQQEVAMATVRQLDPVYVDLSQAAAEARNLQERLTASRLRNDKTQYEVTLYLNNTDETYSHKGTLDATDLAVDIQTGAIRLRSVFPNPDNILLPGMFVRASIEDLGRAKEIIVPQKSVNIEPDGSKSVWVVMPDDTAEKRTIRTGAAYRNNWVVLNGLKSGDRVIVEGQMRLQEGASLKAEKMTYGIQGQQQKGHREKDVPVRSLAERAPPPAEPAPSKSSPNSRQMSGPDKQSDQTQSTDQEH